MDRKLKPSNVRSEPVEWRLYASGARNEPAVKVKNVMYRKDPIIFGMLLGISGKSVPLSGELGDGRK